MNTDFNILTNIIELTPEKRQDKSKIFERFDKTPQYVIKVFYKQRKY